MVSPNSGRRVSTSPISVIIPAYNEEKSVADVIKAVKGNRKVKEIIIVNDGSTDSTVEKVRQFGEAVSLLNYRVNRGKGFALYRGIRKAKYPLVVLVDADLVGLRPAHIDRLIAPLEKGKADLVLARINILRSELDKYFGGYFKRIDKKRFSPIAGQRAAFRRDLINIRGIKAARYGADLLIIDYYLSRGKRIKPLIFNDVKHYKKTEKWGKEGLKMYALMLKDILQARHRLEAGKALLRRRTLSKRSHH